MLRYLEDMPDEAIADLLGCQPATVRSLASRGLAAVRPLLAAGTAGQENQDFRPGPGSVRGTLAGQAAVGLAAGGAVHDA